MRDSFLPIALIAGGIVWLLFNVDWIPSFDWVVTIVLVGAGIAILFLEGITKKSVIGGPLLIALGITWLLHFHFDVRWRFLAPSLFIVAGLLMLASRSAAVPEVRRRAISGRPADPH